MGLYFSSSSLIHKTMATGVRSLVALPICQGLQEIRDWVLPYKRTFNNVTFGTILVISLLLNHDCRNIIEMTRISLFKISSSHQ
jgi:hypothetical protein